MTAAQHTRRRVEAACMIAHYREAAAAAAAAKLKEATR